MLNLEEKVRIAAGNICDVYRVTVGGELRALKEYSLFRLKKLKIHGYRGLQTGVQALENEVAVLSSISQGSYTAIAVRRDGRDEGGSCNIGPPSSCIVRYYDCIRDESEGTVCLLTEYLSFGKSMILKREHIVRAESSEEEDDDENFLLRYYSYKFSSLVDQGSSLEAKSSLAYFSEQDALGLFSDLIHGIEFLHSRGIAHLDIKPENLLISESHRLKISDFGSSIQFDLSENHEGIINHTPGTQMFWPPSYVHAFEDTAEVELAEVFSSTCDEPVGEIEFAVVSSEDMAAFERVDNHPKSSAFSADLYAAGVTFYCFLHGMLPFCDTLLEVYPGNLYKRIIEKQFRINENLKEKSSFILNYLLPLTGVVVDRKRIVDDVKIALSLDV